MRTKEEILERMRFLSKKMDICSKKFDEQYALNPKLKLMEEININQKMLLSRWSMLLWVLDLDHGGEV